MSSKPNSSSKPVLDYSKVFKKNTQTQESDTKTAPPVQVQEPVKSGKKLSDAR